MSCRIPSTPYDRVIAGDWSELKNEVCPGKVEVWDQTVGCPECGMNLWYLPDPDDGKWPAWDAANAPASDTWDNREERYKNDPEYDPYKAYDDLFTRLHPTPWLVDDEEENASDEVSP